MRSRDTRKPQLWISRRAIVDRVFLVVGQLGLAIHWKNISAKGFACDTFALWIAKVVAKVELAFIFFAGLAWGRIALRTCAMVDRVCFESA